MNELDKIKEDLDFLCNTTYKIDGNEWLKDMIKDTFIILKFLREKKHFCRKNLSKQIDVSIELFELVNKYEKNRGYQKLAKQAKLLKEQYAKYKTDQKMKSGLKEFFDDYSGERVPSHEDVLTLVAHNIKQVLIYAYKIELAKAKKMAYEIVKIVLNDDKKFTGKIIKEGVSIETNDGIIVLDCYPKAYGRSPDAISSDYISLYIRKTARKAI